MGESSDCFGTMGNMGIHGGQDRGSCHVHMLFLDFPVVFLESLHHWTTPPPPVQVPRKTARFSHHFILYIFSICPMYTILSALATSNAFFRQPAQWHIGKRLCPHAVGTKWCQVRGGIPPGTFLALAVVCRWSLEQVTLTVNERLQGRQEAQQGNVVFDDEVNHVSQKDI